MSKRKPVVTVDTTDKQAFESQCAWLCGDGYKMAACDVGFLDSEKHEFAPSYMAVFVDTGVFVQSGGG